MRVAVLGAPGPAARSERVASGGGRGLKRLCVCGSVTTFVVYHRKVL